MYVEEQIKAHIASLPQAKGDEMLELHRLIQQIQPTGKLWFDDGRNGEGKTVTNPTIGYGVQTIQYANGTTRDFFKIGISANTTGISVYILGIKDKAYLAQTYGDKLGKASVTGYCIKFKTLKNINIDVLAAAIQYGFEAHN